MSSSKPIIQVLVGPTASGKTLAAIELAKSTNSEIINADSRQIYKELSIGTAKPKIQNSDDLILVDDIIHYGFDLCSLKDDFSAGIFLDYFYEKAELILAKGKNIILTGGTGLYIDVCMNGLSQIPEITKEIKLKVNEIISTEGLEAAYQKLREFDKITVLDEKNPRRVARALEVYLATNISLGEWHEINKKSQDKYEFKIIFLEPERTELYERINQRVIWMIKSGMLDEAKMLLDMNLPLSTITKAGIGYKYLIQFLKNELSLNEATELVQRDTRHYAKRQMTWFKKYKIISPSETQNK